MLNGDIKKERDIVVGIFRNWWIKPVVVGCHKRTAEKDFRMLRRIKRAESDDRTGRVFALIENNGRLTFCQRFMVGELNHVDICSEKNCRLAWYNYTPATTHH